ncbi:MAG: hypothetical protein R3320_06250 [Nitriliruptorales bacterium]|nr:hypothetical protein [Nitriliruptorales bacterium]
MYTFVEHTQPLEGPAWVAIERFTAEPVAFLPAPAHRLEGDRWRVTLHAGPVQHEVALSVGGVWTLPDAWIRPVNWEPTRRREREPKVSLLPRFTGRVALRQYDSGLQLEIAGHYSPPLGRAGEVLDLQLHRVAERTIETLADDIAAVFRENAEQDPATART